MNVLFVYTLYNIASPSKPIQTPEVMQFGISYISSFLEARGHNTKLVVLSRISGEKNKQLLDEYINNFLPKLICFTAVSSEYDFIVSLAKYIKNKYHGIYLIIGGPHVSLNPEGVLDNFDALCIGEGEYPTLELASQLEKNKAPSGIPNLWIKQKSKIEKNPTRPFLQNLDALPFPDREMWSEWVQEAPGVRHSLLLGRGCPFECTYCSNHALKKISSGEYTRYRSPGNILREIREITDGHPDTQELYLEVESIGVNKNWILALCRELELFNRTREYPVSFGANIRITPNMDLADIFTAFKKSNFRFINIGLESGSERIRREVLNRHYTNADIREAVRLARVAGLQVSFLNMIGLLGETISDFQETIAINRECLPDWVGYSIFYPYPGTKIYAECKARGFIQKSLPTDRERSKAILDLPGFSRKQIQKNYVWFEYNVYRGHRPLLRLLLRVLVLKIKADDTRFALCKQLKRFVNRIVAFLPHTQSRATGLSAFRRRRPLRARSREQRCYDGKAEGDPLNRMCL